MEKKISSREAGRSEVPQLVMGHSLTLKTVFVCLKKFFYIGI